MDALILKPVRGNKTLVTASNVRTTSTDKPFIQANTIESSLEEIKANHIIPVFTKDNEALISHCDFIEATADVVADVLHGEQLLKPAIRLSHPIKGRIPQAKDKPAHKLLEHEKTLWYERLAFVIEIPTIHEEIDGNTLSLTVGGVKAYNEDNLANRKGADEHFKIFIGFKNTVCTNLCVSTDGYMSDLKVTNIGQLKACIRTLIENFDRSYNLHSLRAFADYTLTEVQFAELIGRCRMYPYLPRQLKSDIPELLFGETQIGVVVRDYYKDHSFCKGADGNISLWKVYNLFTSANKSSYIDLFLDRAKNAFSFVHDIKSALQNKGSSWYLSR